MEAISEFLDGCRVLHFVPYALAEHDAYTQRVRTVLHPLGIEVIGLNAVPNPREVVAEAEVLFVGGGNTFRLLRSVQQLGLVKVVRQRVLAGELSYLGSSAGTNHACPTIRTTNDMPIVQPTSFEAFGLVPFQINPHYQDADPRSTHMGETREERIRQFLEENDVPVLGMREGAWLRCRGRELTLQGQTGALLFQRGTEPTPYEAAADLSFLLNRPTQFDRPA
jgi:dipeptidase E